MYSRLVVRILVEIYIQYAKQEPPHNEPKEPYNSCDPYRAGLVRLAVYCAHIYYGSRVYIPIRGERGIR